MNGDRIYVATTVGDDVILGAATSRSAQANNLTVAYSEFKTEAPVSNLIISPRQSTTTPGYRPNKCGWYSFQEAETKLAKYLRGLGMLKD